MAEALYRKVEFVTDLAEVWERLRSGWDWLGVSAEHEFVLGYPRRAGAPAKPPDITIAMPQARPGEHGIRVESPVAATTIRWYASEAQAREEFARVVEDLQRQRHAPPSLALVQRVEQGAVVEETFVVTHA